MNLHLGYTNIKFPSFNIPFLIFIFYLVVLLLKKFAFIIVKLNVNFKDYED